MKHTRKIAALLLAAAMAVPAAGCAHSSSGNGNDSGNTQPEHTVDPEISAAVDETGLQYFGFEDNPQNNQFPITEPVVTTVLGTDGSLYIQKTDINGTAVTDPDGSAATELYTGTTLATTYAEPDYQPAYKTYFSMWIDTSEFKDFVFDGDFLEYDIKINDDAKDGVYPIQIYQTDFSNWRGPDGKPESFEAVTNVGYVCINADEPTPAHETGGKITLTPGVVSGKPGDTVKLIVKAENNSGIVAFRLWMSYDSNAMSITGARAGADFATDIKPSGRSVNSSSN